MQNFIGSQILSTSFDFNRETKEFVAEISMLQHGGKNPLGQLYDDACDQGFVMVSAKTNKLVDFYLSDTQRDAEGDVQYWEFKPSIRAVFYNKDLEGVTVIVLND